MPFWETLTPELIGRTVTLTFMLFGLAVLLIPILPGLVIIWAAALGYGIFSGFGVLGWIMFAILSILMIVGSFVDNVLMGTSAHKEGTPWWVILLALVGAIAGNFLLPVVGGVLAALLTLFLVELVRLRNSKKAFNSMKGMLVGCGWAVVIRFIIGLVMVGLWMIWAWT